MIIHNSESLHNKFVAILRQVGYHVPKFVS